MGTDSVVVQPCMCGVQPKEPKIVSKRVIIEVIAIQNKRHRTCNFCSLEASPLTPYLQLLLA